MSHMDIDTKISRHREWKRSAASNKMGEWVSLTNDFALVRRALGQLSALLLLNAGGCPAPSDEVACQTRVLATQLEEMIERRSCSLLRDEMRREQAKVLEAAILAGEALQIMRDRLNASNSRWMDQALRILRAAHRSLAKVADDEADLRMVSFRNACCGVPSLLNSNANRRE
jgi:hypothetical protein